MNKFIINDEAYAELISILDNNDARICIFGERCSGPIFKITASEP